MAYVVMIWMMCSVVTGLMFGPLIGFGMNEK